MNTYQETAGKVSEVNKGFNESRQGIKGVRSVTPTKFVHIMSVQRPSVGRNLGPQGLEDFLNKNFERL